ncbi:tumor necrosis factor receptor superfamily member 5 isoform X2 [Mastacembelus armatus]|uniref:Tumor necrosis factor receptor superfamily member 5-like n=1 Tax=Mastacembelus armatus TaxID=205130 RepID=A0A3Q3L1M8_9TELE|nr:tumor necrosis factor receptor superfamily member 5-like isoform X2 [Mastacembelus armatus]
MTCPSDKYTLKNGNCCDRCPAGMHMQTECDGKKMTECAKCGPGLYTATPNHLNSCHVCADCSSHNKQKKVKDCTATQNTVCECESGFYCTNDQCDHCKPVTICSLGEGVKIPATRTSDTMCAPCANGTYSNVTDFISPCKPHTNCEDFGRVLKIPGTQTTDAVCDDVKHFCSWILPASLWSGLVLTLLVLFAVVICRKAKRASYRAAGSPDPVILIQPVPAAPDSSLEFPLPSTELNGHCQGSCTVEDCKLFFNQDDSLGFSINSSYPITPLKASVSFADSSHNNGSVGHSNFLRTHSEPQEDEWCGT